MEPKQSELSDPKYKHVDEAVKQPGTIKDGYVSLGKAARHQAEAGDGTAPNPVAPPKGAPTPSAHERLRRQAEGQAPPAA